MKLKANDVQNLKILTDNINKLTTTNKTNKNFIDNLKKRLENFADNIPKLNEQDYVKIYRALNTDYENLKKLLNEKLVNEKPLASSLQVAKAGKARVPTHKEKMAEGKKVVTWGPVTDATTKISAAVKATAMSAKIGVAKTTAKEGVIAPRPPLPILSSGAARTLVQNVAKEVVSKKTVAAVTHTGTARPELPPLPPKFIRLGNEFLYPKIQELKKIGRSGPDHQYIPELEKRLKVNDGKIVSDLTAAMQSSENQYQYSKLFSKGTREKQGEMLKFLAETLKRDMDPIAKTLLAERVLTVLNNDLQTESRTWDRQSKLAAIVGRLQTVVNNIKDRLPGYQERSQDKSLVAVVNNELEKRKDLPELKRAVEKTTMEDLKRGSKGKEAEQPLVKGPRKPGR